FQRDWFDRIGFGARTLGAPVQIAPSSPPQPALSALDFLTVNVLGGAEGRLVLPSNQDLQQQIQTRAAAIVPQLPGIDPSNATPAQKAVLDAASSLTRASIIALSRIRLSELAIIADDFDTTYAEAYLVRSYYTMPRLTIVSSRAPPGPSASVPNVSIG